MRPFIIYALLPVLLACPAFSQSPQAADDQTAFTRSGGASAPASKVRPSRNRSQDSSSQWEYWTNVTIAANSYINLDSQLDYSTIGTVRITIRSTGSNLNNLSVAALWAIPEVPYYGVADLVAGRNFVYSNAGGATLNTYGSQFRLQVINNGSTAVTRSQILLYTPSH